MGNHEYYGYVNNYIQLASCRRLPALTFRSTGGSERRAISDYQKLFIDTEYEHRIICIHHRYLVLDEFVLAGATLWYDANYYNRNLSNDYNKIRGVRKKITPPEIRGLYSKDRNFLTDALTKPMEFLDSDMTERKKIVFMTHDPPLSQLDHHNESTNCWDLVDQVDVWLYEHTHIPNEIVINDCMFRTNPLGYPGELKQNLGYIFEI